jgi:poly(3-hydroxybutyrate) depolymerase
VTYRRALSLAVAALALVFFHPRTVDAQSRQPLALVRVIYNTAKTRANPQGELKEQLTALDKEIAEAIRLGRSGEARRLIAKGTALLAGREWTDVLEFTHSLALRADRLFVDPEASVGARIEQIYSPRLALSGSLSARFSLHKPAAPDKPAETPVADFGRFDSIGRDLIDEPYHVDLNLSSVADGTYVLQAALFENERALGDARLELEVVRGLDKRLHKLDADLKGLKGVDAIRADVRYPADYIGKVNRGLVQKGTFNVVQELARAEEILAGFVKSGKDPFAGRTGDFERHYLLEDAGEIMPYRVYVPTKYNPKQTYPLIVALHGLGANEDSFFDRYERRLPQLAEERGYLVVAPLGYRVDGAYGTGLAAPPEDSGQRRKMELSEKDVMTVLDRMRKSYAVDQNRIYLMGHSMGAIGTWRLAAKYPGLWAALGPIAGTGDPQTVPKMGPTPQIVVHGDADPTVLVGGSRRMVAEMQRLGVTHRYIEVPGGNHLDIVVPNLTAIFDFFDAHRRTSSPKSDQEKHQ